MRKDKPKLFADWREFFREFIIIVLGVFTALLAQSVAEDFAWREKVHAATDDMRQELGAGGTRRTGTLQGADAFPPALDVGRRARGTDEPGA